MVLKLYLCSESELMLLFSGLGKDGFVPMDLNCKNSFTCVLSRISYLGAIKIQENMG